MQKTTRISTGKKLQIPKILFLILIAFIVSVKVSARQTDNTALWKTVRLLIDSIQENDSIKTGYITSSNGLTDVYEDTTKIFKDSVFSQADIRFFRKQLGMYRTMEWADSNKPDNIKILQQSTITSLMIKGPSGWDKLSKKCGKGYKTYSFPLFNSDMSYAVMAESYHTPHKTTGGTCLFKNVKGSWKRIKTYATWSGY